MEPDLAAAIADLTERVRRLEQRTLLVGSGPAGMPDAPAADGGPAPAAGHVGYAGVGPWEDSAVAWRMERTWDEVVAGVGEHVARVLSGLASGVRLRIVGELATGPLATGDLAARLDQPSSGQLFHHLKELMAVGLVHQPQRGVYALRRQHVLPILTVLSAAIDLAPSAASDPA